MIEIKIINTDSYGYLGNTTSDNKLTDAGIKLYNDDSGYYIGEFKDNSNDGCVGAFISNTKGKKDKCGVLKGDMLTSVGLASSSKTIELGFFKDDVLESGFTLKGDLTIEFSLYKYKNYKLCFDLAKNKVTIVYVGKKKNYYLQEASLKMGYKVEKTLPLGNILDYYNSISSKGVSEVKDFDSSKNIPDGDGFALIEDSSNGSIIASNTYNNKSINVIIKKNSEKILGYEIESNLGTLKIGKDKLASFSFEFKNNDFLYSNLTLGFDDGVFTMEINDSSFKLKIDELMAIFYGGRFKNRLDFGVDDRSLHEVDEDAEEKLQGLIGIETVKRQIRRVKATTLKNGSGMNLHMVFLGNAGTGKTTVARLMGSILYLNGILPRPIFVNGNRDTLVGRYTGHTSIKTNQACDEAMGGVLFIDEAYALYSPNSKRDYGSEAIASLIKRMEDDKGKFCCILAGYDREMENMMNENPGFKSRIQFTIHFDDYSSEELRLIAIKNIEEYGLKCDEDVLNKIVSILTFTKETISHFGNAREVRKIIESLQLIAGEKKSNTNVIEMEDINLYMEENTITLTTLKECPKPDLSVLRSDYEKYYKYESINNKLDYLTEAVVQLVNTYDKESVRTSGIIISRDGYAITNSLDINECKKSIATRIVSDRLGNRLRVNHDIRIVKKESMLNTIKIDYEGSMIPYIPINSEKEITEGLDVVAIGIEQNSHMTSAKNPIIIKRAKVKSITSDGIFYIDINDNTKFFNGAAIVDVDTSSLLGILFYDGSVVPSSLLCYVINDD